MNQCIWLEIHSFLVMYAVSIRSRKRPLGSSPELNISFFLARKDQSEWLPDGQTDIVVAARISRVVEVIKRRILRLLQNRECLQIFHLGHVTRLQQTERGGRGIGGKHISTLASMCWKNVFKSCHSNECLINAEGRPPCYVRRARNVESCEARKQATCATPHKVTCFCDDRVADVVKLHLAGAVFETAPRSADAITTPINHR